MNNITDELAKLHELTGAEFSRQVERIALRNEFHPLEGETDIYITGGEKTISGKASAKNRLLESIGQTNIINKKSR